jgi:hypothetical protein
MTSRTVDTHKIQIIGDFDEANPSRGDVRIEYADDNNREHTNSPDQLELLDNCPNWPGHLPVILKTCPHHWQRIAFNGVCVITGAANWSRYTASQTDGGELRAATGPDYGRIYDWEILEPIKHLVDASGGRWKVPGMMVGHK